MPGPVQLNRTFDPAQPLEPSVVKRGGGGGNGPNPLHRTMGDLNDLRQLPPPGYGQTEYRRRFFNNIAGLLGFIAPTAFVPTMNKTSDDGTPKNNVPWGRRWYSGTFRPNWYRGLWTVYVPNSMVNLQRGVVPRVVDKQRQMGRPNPNLLTVYRRYPPYSAQTKTLGGR